MIARKTTAKKTARRSANEEAAKKAAAKKAAAKKAAAKKAATKKAAAKKAAAKKTATKKTATKKTATKKTAAAAPKKTALAAQTERSRLTRRGASGSRRPASRVSPLAGMSVDDWAARVTGWQADALRLIRALVARHAPHATLGMKWGRPVWEHHGPFAWVHPAAKHVSFGFWRGAELSDPQGVLEGSGDRMRHVKLTSADDVSRLPLDELVAEAAHLNATKGDPTRRAT